MRFGEPLSLAGEQLRNPWPVDRAHPCSLADGSLQRLLELGVYVTGFGYPVVPEGTAGVRIQVSAALTQAQLEQAAAALERAAIEQGLLATAPAD